MIFAYVQVLYPTRKWSGWENLSEASFRVLDKLLSNFDILFKCLEPTEIDRILLRKLMTISIHTVNIVIKTRLRCYMYSFPSPPCSYSKQPVLICSAKKKVNEKYLWKIGKLVTSSRVWVISVVLSGKMCQAICFIFSDIVIKISRTRDLSFISQIFWDFLWYVLLCDE